MLKLNFKTAILLFILFLYTCLSPFLLNWNSSFYFNYLNPIFWFVFLIIGILFFRNDYCRKKYKYDFIQIVIISVIIYLILFYTAGLITGYTRLPYARTVTGVLKNILQYVFPIVSMEYLRQCFINRSGKNKILLIIITGIFAAINITLQTYNFSIVVVDDVFDLLFSIVIPEIAKSMLLSYLTYRSDFVASLIYAIVPAMLMYIIPILPDLNWFLDGSLQLILAFVVYFVCNQFYVSKYEIKTKRKKVYISLLPLLVIVIPIIILISGVFKYQLLAVLTNSMKPVYSRGDAILIEHLDEDEKQDLKEGDIIVFIYHDRRVLHRIVEIDESISGVRTYKTKGDNLETEDAWVIKDQDIEGKYIATVPKIGYPSVWISEFTME